MGLAFVGGLLFFVLVFIPLSIGQSFNLPITPLVHQLGDGEGHWGYGIEYSFELEVGAPAQIIPVVLDSGSPSIIIYGSSCKMPDCAGRATYDYNVSDSWSSLGKPAISNYIAGSMSGIYGMDDLWITSDPVNITFAVMDKVNWTMPYFSNFNFSGIFGASMSPSQVQNTSFIYQSFQQGQIGQDIFGFMASPDPYGTGEVIFGSFNEDATTNGITWHDVISFEPVPGRLVNWLWALPASGLSVNGQALNGNCSNTATPCIVVIDTGGAMTKFTGPGMPSLSVSPDCSNLNSLPTVTFTINSQDFIFAPTDYVFKYVANNGTALCVSNAFGVDGPEISATFGGRFFAKYYSIFSNGNQTIGFSLMN